MAKWGTKTPPNKKGRYLVTVETTFGNQIRQADRVEAHYEKGKYLLPIFNIELCF